MKFYRTAAPYTGLAGEDVHLFQTGDELIGLTIYDYRGTLTADAYYTDTGAPAPLPDRHTLESLVYA